MRHLYELSTRGHRGANIVVGLALAAGFVGMAEFGHPVLLIAAGTCALIAGINGGDGRE